MAAEGRDRGAGTAAEGYERYREALREGHVAAELGDHSAAHAAFAEAAALAPDRPLPLVGLGEALRALGRPREALEVFERARQLAPLDEGALRGTAATLVALGRQLEAAVTLTGLAESLEADGRSADALEPAREALALDSAPARFRLVARLSAAAQAAAQERAGETARADDRATEGPRRRARGPRGQPVGASLIAEADALVDGARTIEARDRYLLAARALGEGGRLVAALDACYLALSIAPADAELHLILAELLDDGGWSGEAADKLVLLARLLDLEEDGPSRSRLCELAATRFPTDRRLAAICT